MNRKFFPSLKKYSNLIFCDNAGGSQIPIQVLNSTNKILINNYVQPNANNILSRKITDDFNNIKNITNIIFNNKKNGDLVFGSSASQLFYNLANSIDKSLILNKNIILPNFSHESCVCPFERIFKQNGSEGKWWEIKKKNDNINLIYDDLLEKIDDKTSIIVLPHVSNILGNVLDIEFISKEIKAINSNIKILVDGVAYFPHDSIDINSYDIDFYCISFYKFCGLRVSTMFINNLNSLNNQNHYFFNEEYFNNSSKKLEIGGWNFESASSILGLKDYFEEILDKKNITFNRNSYEEIMLNIKNHENKLTKKFYKNLKYNNEIKLIELNENKKFPIFSIYFKNFKCYNVNLILNELGLICSNSTYYCDRLFDNLDLCKQNGVLRISLMHYNNIKEVNKICKLINMFKKYELNFTFSNYKYQPSLKLKDSFNYLEQDKYYNLPRYRAFSLINVIDDIPKIIGNLKFFQSLNYNKFNGNNLRDYKNIDSNILNDSSFLKYINYFKNKIYLETKQVPEYIQIHQIRVNANLDSTNLVPEGIHRDGFNLIGIVVIHRENINHGINNIYDKNKNIIYSKKLLDGDMVVVNDNDYYHDVTNISITDPNKIGYRDVFVFTSLA